MDASSTSQDSAQQSTGNITADHRTEILAEYNALRSEILNRFGERHQILTATIAILGAILTFSKDQTAIVLLAYPFLSTFLAIGWSHADFRIAEIAGYIRKEIEPKLKGVKWETRLSEMRRTGSIGRFIRPAELSAIGVFVGTEALAIGLAIPRWTSTIQERSLLAVDVVGIILTFLVIQRRRIWHGKSLLAPSQPESNQNTHAIESQ